MRHWTGIGIAARHDAAALAFSAHGVAVVETTGDPFRGGAALSGRPSGTLRWQVRRHFSLADDCGAALFADWGRHGSVAVNDEIKVGTMRTKEGCP